LLITRSAAMASETSCVGLRRRFFAGNSRVAVLGMLDHDIISVPAPMIDSVRSLKPEFGRLHGTFLRSGPMDVNVALNAPVLVAVIVA
jgi:hypothetical protein